MAHRVSQGVQLAGYRRDDVEVDPPYLHPDYVATRTRAPKRPLLLLPHTLTEVTGPVYGHERVGELDHDLTRQHDGEPLGERIILHGRVLDGDRRPVRNTLVEIWQANAAGRYRHAVDRHPAPLDPNFTGAGRCMTDDEGRYRFITVKPGAYPWRNHPNAWRAAHIHISLFGPGFRHAARHADVLPRRPALLPGPDLPLRARPQAPRADDLRVRPRQTVAGVGARLQLRHRPARARGHADGGLR